MRLKLNRTNIRKIEAKSVRFEVSDTDTPAFRLRITPNGIKTFVLAYRNAENKLRRFTIGKFGDLTPEQARDIAQKKLAEVKLGTDPAEQKQTARREAEREAEQAKVMTLGGFIENKYGPWVIANRKDGAATVKRLHSLFGEFMDRQLPDINTWVVEKWRKGRLEQGRTVATVNRDLVALKACLSRAVDWDLIDKHPLTRVKPGKVDNAGVVRYLSDDEEARFRTALKARDNRMRTERASANEWRRERGRETMPEVGTFGDHLTPMVLASINTGLRRGELFNLTWQDIDLDRASLAVRGEGAKSGTTRHIPLNDEAVASLRTWQHQTGATAGLVFPGKTGLPLTHTKRSWANLLKAAGIEGFTWHCLRHHFASRLVTEGVDLNTVRELLGHSDIKMTLRYAHLAPEHKAAAVAKLVTR